MSDGPGARCSLGALFFSGRNIVRIQPRNDERKLPGVQCNKCFSVLKESSKCNVQLVKWLPWRN